MAKTTFGNPEAKAFEKQQLRWATHGDVRVRVHRLIWPLVNRILIGLDQAGGDLSAVSTAEGDPLKVSFVVGDLGDLAETFVPQVAAAGFVYEDGSLRFEGSADDAEAASAALGTPVDEMVEESLEAEPVEAERVPPADRLGGSVSIGSEGKPVSFVQSLIGARPTGKFSEDDAKLLARWQERHWLEPTGEFLAADWRSVLPRRAIWLRPGATGPHIKTLQAAFLSLGFQTGPLTGVWGVRFSHSVRLFQEAHGLVPRLRVGALEWGLLFAPIAEEEADPAD